jgi:N-acyl-D-aspartate/D-glutamate deacylase
MKKVFIGFVKLIGLFLLLFVSWFIGSVWWPLDTPEAPARYATLLIKNTNIIDVRSGEIVPAQDIFVRDGMIVNVGVNLGIDAGQVVDGSGKFAMPGLFDMHMHSFKMSPSLTHPMFVAAGVTAVRDLGGCPGIYDAWVACAEEKNG